MLLVALVEAALPACAAAQTGPAPCSEIAASPSRSAHTPQLSLSSSTPPSAAPSNPDTPAGVSLAQTAPDQYLSWRLANRSAREIRLPFADPHFERLDLDGRWVREPDPTEWRLAARPVVGPGAGIVISGSNNLRPLPSAGTYRFVVQFEDPEHPAAPHFASISFDLIGLTASQAEAALAALRELPPPHRSGLYPRLIALAPPAFLPRLLESPGLGLDERHEICSWLAEIARAWSILHVATRSEDEDTALAAAAVLAHFDPDPVAEPLFSGPLLAALDGRPDLPPWAIEALGIRSQTSRDASIVQRLIDRIPNLSEPALFAMAEILVVASTHDQPRFDRATLRRGARALRNAARRATPRGRASLREAAAIIEHPVPFGPVWGDGLDNQDAVGFMIDDPRLEPLSGPNWMSLRVVVH